MKIGIMTDIHSNILALDTLLAEFAHHDLDEILFAGDAVGLGPRPEEVVQRLMTIPNLRAVAGNSDLYMREEFAGISQASGLQEHYAWTKERLSARSLEFLASFPLEQTLEREGKTFHLIHYPMTAPGVYKPYLYPSTWTGITELFSNYKADVHVYGHEHSGYWEQQDGRWFVNTRSLGCPARTNGLARGGIFSFQNGRIKFEYVAVPYHKQIVIDDIDHLKYPHYEMLNRYFFGAYGGMEMLSGLIDA